MFAILSKFLSVLAVALLFAPLTGEAAVSLPSGFDISLVSKNLLQPTAMEFSPDGRLFVSLKSGQLRVIKRGMLLDQPFLTVTTDTQGEHGLIGVAFDPDFRTNSYVYVYYVPQLPAIHGRVSRFTANGDVAVVGSEKILMELDNRGTSIFHVAGGIHFGPDGKLYVTSGDNAGVPDKDNSQRLTTVLGKVLRINSDGSIPSDNPFVATTTGLNQAIWATGFRNPFSLSVQPGTGKIFVNDVGQSTWEEIDELVGGANYGWPLAEGMSTNPSFKNPIYAYHHGATTDDTMGCGITGGTFYNPIMPQFPSKYVGMYFFLDYCNNWIHVLDPVTGVESPFGENVGSSVVGLTQGPDGSLYFMSEWFNSVYKLSFTGSQAPVIMTQPEDEVVGVSYPATWSVDVTGAQPVTYQWQRNGVNLPSATSATYTLPNATLADNGAQFQCVVTNAYGSVISSAANLSVLNSSPPNVSIDYPLDGATYRAGDTVYFGAAASDAQGVPLSPAAFAWNVYFHHDTHFHPFVSNETGVSEGFFQIPTQGETSGNTWFRIVLTVKNADGLSTTITRLIYPMKQNFVLQTSPPGLQIQLDGQPVTAPSTVTGVVGFSRSLSAVSPQTLNGVTYEFKSWSDGLAATHNFRTSISKRAYTAVYQPVGSTRSGTLTATPNPALVCDGSRAGISTLTWNTVGTKKTEVRINAPNGNLLIGGATSGSVTTGKWIGDNSTFYLQDVSDGLPLTQDNTLAAITITLTDYGCYELKQNASFKSLQPLPLEFENLDTLGSQ